MTDDEETLDKLIEDARQALEDATAEEVGRVYQFYIDEGHTPSQAKQLTQDNFTNLNVERYL